MSHHRTFQFRWVWVESKETGQSAQCEGFVVLFFQWTAEIIEHLAEHDVSPNDFEHVVQKPGSQE